MSSVLVVGSVAFDSIETPFGQRDEVLGGSATFFSVCSSMFVPVKAVAVVGEDFPEEHLAMLRARGVDLSGLVRKPGRTFRYTADGPVGLAGGRRVIVASTRGGMYSVGAASGMDFQESYLKVFFGFLGITDVQFVRAERLSKGAEMREQSIAEATTRVPAVVAHALAA